MANKRALIVGINYPGTSHELRGCVNDALAMESLLKGHYGFQDITKLLDHQATTKNILDELEKLVAGAKAGDILFFHYSGHGSQFPDNMDNDFEPDGLDEIICPVDLNWDDKMIRDDDLKRIFDKVPLDVNLTVVLDCCNSGGGLDQLNQFKPLGEARQVDHTDPMKEGGRFLPPPPNAVALTESRNLTFKKSRSLVSNREVNKTGLLISGCQSHQTSADAYIGGKYMGACTYMVIDVLKSHNYDVNYKTLVQDINQRMVQNGFTQRPELNGSSSLFANKFLAPTGESNDQEGDPTNPNQPVDDATTQDPSAPVTDGGNESTGGQGSGSATTGGNSGDGGKDSNKTVLIVVVIAALAALAFFAT